MDKHFQEIELVWKVRIVAKTEVARGLMMSAKACLDEAASKIPNVLISESVIEAWQINQGETK